MKKFLLIAIPLLTVSMGWNFYHDNLICTYIAIFSIYFVLWLLRFPETTYLLMDKLKQKEIEKKDLPISSHRSIILHDFLQRHTDVEHFVKVKTRYHDSHSLINDTQKAILIGTIGYAFIFLGAMIITNLMKHQKDYNPEFISTYKDISSIVVIGSGFFYLILYFMPLYSQRKKNDSTLEV